jgi:hypothetical protein
VGFPCHFLPARFSRVGVLFAVMRDDQDSKLTLCKRGNGSSLAVYVLHAAVGLGGVAETHPAARKLNLGNARAITYYLRGDYSVYTYGCLYWRRAGGGIGSLAGCLRAQYCQSHL